MATADPDLDEALHLCVAMRGVREAVPRTRTTSWRGEYASDAEPGAEFSTDCGPPR
jgi:GTP cyclohydrolase I